VSVTRRWRTGRSRQRIHVETFIRAGIADVWHATQTPELHARWDFRFSSITFDGPPDDEQGVRRFRYTRRLAPGVSIHGWGETVGDRRRADGTATSALRFGSGDVRSLIRAGSGYWQYVPMDGGVRFVTAYDYEVRWGPFGRLVDRAFRPALAWATARSFERLRRWLEEGIEP
jgi:hypothetical protein